MNKYPLFKVFVLLFSVALLISACRVNQTPTPIIRNFDIVDLLINARDLPNGWQQKGEPERFQEVGAIDAAEVSFFADIDKVRNGSSLGIYNYGTSEEAERVYKRMYELGVYGDLPPGWDNPQFFASQYKVGCYNWEGREPYACTWVARYQEFIMQFNTWIIPGFMSFDDVESVVIAIDLRMKIYLDLPTETPTNK